MIIYPLNILKKRFDFCFKTINGYPACIKANVIGKKFSPGFEIIGKGWPKIFQPDYTEVITQIAREKPDAVYSSLWGGDLVSFIDQASLYGIFKKTELFAINLADYTTMSAIKNLPKGLHSATRYIAAYPNTKEKKSFDSAYTERFGDHPTNWSW